MTLHTYEVTLCVSRFETIVVCISDTDPVWVNTPDEPTLEREARERAYRSCRHECYIVGSEKIDP